MTVLKLILKIMIAPVILLLTLAIWICVGLVYVSGLVLSLVSMVFVLLGVGVLMTYSPQNGLILLVIAYLPLAHLVDNPQLYGIVRTVDDISYGGLGNAAFHIQLILRHLPLVQQF